jgi:hypothetical protein
LHIKKALNFKFTFEHEIAPLKNPLELNIDVLIPYKEKKNLNNIKQEQKQRPNYMSTT